MLQYQNHKLAQQLEHQRSEIGDLEDKCCQFKSKQASYDDTLITVNRAWDLVSVILLFLLPAVHIRVVGHTTGNFFGSYIVFSVTNKNAMCN